MDSSCSSETLPRLVIARPSPLRGTVLALSAGRLVLGRGADCDLKLNDAHVSLAHAVLECSSAQTTVQDLGSTNGTLVNGLRIASPHLLRHGDMLRFGTVEARYEEPAAEAAPAAGAADGGSVDLQADIAVALSLAPAGRHARLALARDPATPANGAAGRPAEQHIQQIIVGQADRLRQIAATGSRARHLAAVGCVLFAFGTGIITGVLVRLASQVHHAVAAAAANPATQPSAPPIFGPAIRGVPIGAVGFAAVLVGIIVMIVGIVPYLNATSRRRCTGSWAQPPQATRQASPEPGNERRPAVGTIVHLAPLDHAASQ